MHVRRGLLFWGFFLLPLGAIPLLARAGLVDTGVAADAVRLWPLLLVVIGLVILLSRTRISLIGTAMVAVLFGSLAGTALAAGPAWIAEGVGCGEATGSAVLLQQNGTFDGPALVLLDLRCGTVTLDTAAGIGLAAGRHPRWAGPDRRGLVESPGGHAAPGRQRPPAGLDGHRPGRSA